jgi:hypothetical protein
MGDSELRHANNGVVLDSRASDFRVMVAVHAVVDVGALHVDGLVLLAGNIGDTIVEHVTVGSSGVSSIARTGMSAVDQGLDRGDDIAVNALGLDLEAVTNRGKGRMSPARAAVDGDMLVQVASKESLLTIVQRDWEI